MSSILYHLRYFSSTFFFLAFLCLCVSSCSHTESKTSGVSGYLVRAIPTGVKDFQFGTMLYRVISDSTFLRFDEKGNKKLIKFKSIEYNDQWIKWNGNRVVIFEKKETPATPVNISHKTMMLSTLYYDLYGLDSIGNIFKLDIPGTGNHIKAFSVASDGKNGIFFSRNDSKPEVNGVYYFDLEGHYTRNLVKIDDDQIVCGIKLNRDSSFWMITADKSLLYGSKRLNHLLFVDKQGRKKNYDINVVLEQFTHFEPKNIKADGSSIVFENSNFGAILVNSKDSIPHLIDFPHNSVIQFSPTNDGNHFWIETWDHFAMFDLKGQSSIDINNYSKKDTLRKTFYEYLSIGNNSVWYKNGNFLSTININHVKEIFKIENFDKAQTIDERKTWVIFEGKSEIDVIDGVTRQIKVIKIPSKLIGFNTFLNRHFGIVLCEGNKSYLINDQMGLIEPDLPIFENAAISYTLGKDPASGFFVKTEDEKSYFVLPASKIDLKIKVETALNIYDSELILNLKSPFRDTITAVPPKILVKVIDSTNGRPVGGNEIADFDAENVKIPLQLNPNIQYGKKYQIIVDYTDASNSHIVFKQIYYLKKPFFKSTVFITTVLFISIIILFVLSQKFKVGFPLFSKWFPLLFWTASAFSGAFGQYLFTAFSSSIDSSLLLLYLGLSIPILLCFGFLNPIVFRTIAGVAPFHFLSPIVSALPNFRKRYYKEHIDILRFVVNEEKIDLKSKMVELYTPIPAEFIIGEKTILEKEPVVVMLKQITDYYELDDEARHMTIIAPGGTGKSALLRAFTLAYLSAFEKNPALPLPIYINGAGKSISKLSDKIKEALGKFLISEELFSIELNNGRYFLIIDGLSEAIIDSKTIEEFISMSGNSGNNSPVLFSARPNETIEKELSRSKNLVSIQPKKLNETTITLFEEGYLGSGGALNAELRNICRSRDGNYLPILVRLAIFVKDKNVSDVFALYDKTVEALLKTDSMENAYKTTVSIVARLCVESYGTFGSRDILVNDSNNGTINILVKAGLLIPIGNSNPLRSENRAFKFIHDTIQTYFTALGFFRPSVAALDPKIVKSQLINLALNPIYTKDKSELIFKNGTEIYQMAILLLIKYNVDLVSIISDEILSVANNFELDYSTRNILQSLPNKIVIDRAEDLLAKNVVVTGLKLCNGDVYQISEFYHNILQIMPAEVFINLSTIHST